MADRVTLTAADLARRAMATGVPMLGQMLRLLLAAMLRAAKAVAAIVRTHRSVALALVWRATWWAALGVLVIFGGRLFGWQVDMVDERLVVPFAIGLCACGLIVVLAAERHLRWLATALGTAHGTFALLAWWTLHG